MSDVKSVSITGAAAQEIMGGKLKRGRRSTKKAQEGGSADEQRGVSSVMTAVKGVESPSQLAQTAASPMSSTWLKYPEATPVPPKIVSTPSHVPATPQQSAAPTGQYGGATKHIKVELKKKMATKKVHLNPKKAEAPKAQVSKKHTTRRARKVTIGVSNLHKRLTRAKKLHKQVKEMPIDKLKEKLIKGGLIKPNSKAPDSILRQIAADSEVVKNKAL
jgi:hypothetical protein